MVSGVNLVLAHRANERTSPGGGGVVRVSFQVIGCGPGIDAPSLHKCVDRLTNIAIMTKMMRIDVADLGSVAQVATRF